MTIRAGKFGKKCAIACISYLFALCLLQEIAISNAKAKERDEVGVYGGNNTQIGLAVEAINVVKGSLDVNSRTIKVSDAVFQQELIETNSVSATEFLFLDETILVVGPESQLVLNEMVFDANATKGKVVLTAVKGLFTFVSGSLPSESYQIQTPTATIGVRGTKFDLFVSRNGASTVVLRRGAVDVKNLQGATRRIATINSATTVVTKKTQPTPAAPPTPELEKLFEPLSNLKEFGSKDTKKININREEVEKKSNINKENVEKQQDLDIKKEKAKNKEARKKEKAKNKEARKKEKAERKEARKKEKAERKEARKKEKAEKQAVRKKERTKKREIKRDKIEKRRTKKAAKKASASAKKASKGAKAAAKKASASAKKASKSAKAAAKKASASAKKASKSAKAAAKKARKKALEAKKSKKKRTKS